MVGLACRVCGGFAPTAQGVLHGWVPSGSRLSASMSLRACPCGFSVGVVGLLTGCSGLQETKAETSGPLSRPDAGLPHSPFCRAALVTVVTGPPRCRERYLLRPSLTCPGAPAVR